MEQGEEHTKQEFDVVVTRFQAFVDYLRERGVITEETEVVIAPIKRSEMIKRVTGKRVIGDLSLNFASVAETFTRVRFRTTIRERQTPDKMTVDDVINRLRQSGQPIVTYKIETLNSISLDKFENIESIRIPEEVEKEEVS